MKTMLIIVLAFVSSLVMAQTDVDGFREYKLGTPFDDMSEGLIKSSSLNPGFKGYEKPGDDMMFEGIEAHTIIYLFKKKKLHVVSIGIHNDDVEKAAAAFTAKYGEPSFTENAFIKNYEWEFPSSKIVLSHFLTNPSEKSAAIGIRKK